ncbi:hypothetical protein CEE37_07710 [candidate division LCP-89 bacterium B3_LCP]|uniref:Thioredoxin domain-containing protein n=1 Tax=candidate division LCP-89 bacterium B3_LCP TaxID=2012998 RepID=A0A532V117_UNCL8|nr:MAG: hypothetical protein CEE37_07710 [candidate division LCP-89 bacterium B3_LCP]
MTCTPRNRSLAALLILLVIGSILLSGCEIIQSELPPVGNIYVSAFDQSGMEISGGRIYLDGVERAEPIPYLLENIDIGGHTLLVESEDYYDSEFQINVDRNETSYATFTLTPAPDGFLNASSNPNGVTILVDRRSLSVVTPNLFSDANSGQRTISAFMDGYKTLEPSLITLTISPDDTVQADFVLEAGVAGSQVGDIAFDFTLQDDFDVQRSLHEYRGYIVLLTFFFSDCQPCMEEFPIIDEIYTEYASQGVRVLGIDYMFGDTLEDVKGVRDGLNIHFNLLLDYSAIVTMNYSITSFPTNIVIGPGGDIIAHLGEITYSELTEIFDDIIY